MIFHSIRWRLQLWLAFLLACVLTGFGVAVYQLQRTNQVEQIDEELARRVAALSAVLRGRLAMEFGRGRFPFEDGPGGPRRPPPPGEPPEFPRPGGPRGHWPGGWREVALPTAVASLFDESNTNSFYYGLYSADGVLFKHSTNAPADLSVPARVAATLPQTRERGDFREAYYFTGLGECVVVGRSILADRAALHRFTFWLLAAGGTVLALGLGGGWWLTTRAIRPIDEISATAAKIAAGDLSQRINAADTDNELGRLASVLNSTFSRLDAAFAQQARFTADAAHELRTPVTVMLTHTQNALGSECASEEHREAFEACQRAAQRMRRLIESLLQLARLDAGQEQMRRERFDLSRIAQECVELVRPLAAERDIEIHCDLPAVECVGDAERIGQVITNLVANAIQHNHERGSVRVSARVQNGTAIVAVSDTGPGIATEDLPHVFDRFYRADKSRAGGSGRTGLGLAISKAIVEAHGGTLEVASQPGAGATFTIRLPLAPQPAGDAAP
ncbi:MAG: HAMP domain-containing protein [Verrucomicrobia bacterium]|nr:HAMP domain-containing protein [Verrucomicrobiota bacterium]